MSSPFILNGVCVKWIGWIDLHTLNGKAKLMYDAESAAVSGIYPHCLSELRVFIVRRKTS